MINADGSSTLGRLLVSARALVFHSVKMDFLYDVLDKTSVDVPQPTITINRLKLAARNLTWDSSVPAVDEDVRSHPLPSHLPHLL